MGDSIKNKAISGVFWSSFQKFGTMVISFVSNIVLARLLTPDDYGCIGMLMIFIAISNTFIDGGFGSALIQKKTPTQEDYSTIFYWNIFLSIVLYLILFFIAPYIAVFYKLPLLSDVLRVQGIILILHSLSIIQQNRLRKQLLFKKLSLVNISSAIISVIITIVLAYNGWGVWALVAQQLLMSLLNAILYWIVAHWRPSFVFSKQSFKELFSFGGFILLSNLINTFGNNIHGLLIGRFFSPSTMGLYSQARKLEEVASLSVSSVVDQVIYPVFSRYQDNKQQLVSILEKITTAIAYVTCPLMVILIVVAKPLIIFLYSEKWIDCVPFFQILCIAGVSICLQNINYHVVAAVGKSKSLFNWTIIKRCLAIILLFGGFIIGDIMGIMWGVVIGTWSVFLINARLVSKYIGYKVFVQLRLLFPIFLLSAIIGVVIYYINIPVTNNFLVIVIKASIYLILYVLLSWIMKFDTLITLKNIIINKKI